MIDMMERQQVQKPDDIEVLLPWLATGKLSAGDERRVKAAILQNPSLARDYAAVEEEYNELVLLNESLGAPSPRAMHNLFAMIDDEQSARASAGQMTPATHGSDEGIMARAAAVLSSGRVLGWVAGAGLMVLLVQAIIIGKKIL